MEVKNAYLEIPDFINGHSLKTEIYNPDIIFWTFLNISNNRGPAGTYNTELNPGTIAITIPYNIYEKNFLAITNNQTIPEMRVIIGFSYGKNSFIRSLLVTLTKVGAVKFQKEITKDSKRGMTIDWEYVNITFEEMLMVEAFVKSFGIF